MKIHTPFVMMPKFDKAGVRAGEIVSQLYFFCYYFL